MESYSRNASCAHNSYLPFIIIFLKLFLFDINKIRIRVMVLNAPFNNISVISWWSVLLVEETGVPRENHRLAASH